MMIKPVDEADLLIWSIKLRVSCHFWIDYLFSVFVTRHVDCFRRFVSYESDAQKKKIYVDLDRIDDMKLTDIDSDALGMPETEYEVGVTSVSNTRIVRHDLLQLGDNFRIEVNKAFGSPVRERPANGSVSLRQVEGLAARLLQ